MQLPWPALVGFHIGGSAAQGPNLRHGEGNPDLLTRFPDWPWTGLGTLPCLMITRQSEEPVPVTSLALLGCCGTVPWLVKMLPHGCCGSSCLREQPWSCCSLTAGSGLAFEIKIRGSVLKISCVRKPGHLVNFTTADNLLFKLFRELDAICEPKMSSEPSSYWEQHEEMTLLNAYLL